MYLVTAGILRAAATHPTGGTQCTRRWSRSTGSSRAGRWWSCWRRCCASTPPTRPGTRPRRSSSSPTPSGRPGGSRRCCRRPRAGRWRHPPFAGEVHDGVLWGRGAVDMKQMVAMSVAALGLLARLGVPLRRELKLAVVADEEAGCAAGSAWLVDHHPDKVRAGHALGEVGGATFYLSGRPFYPVQVAEKGIAWLRAVATGATGHGSIPRDDNAVVRLSEFLARVGRRRLPLHPSPEARRFLEALTELQGRAGRAALPLLLHPRWSSLVLDRGVRDPGLARLLSALLRNTASPTVVHAG